MAKQVRQRRDTLSNLNGVIPADGESAWNLTDDRLHWGDGVTLGGIPHANFLDILQSKFEYASAGGSANALTITLPYPPAAYAAPFRVRFKATATNTGATTINVNSLGVKNIYKVAAGAIGPLTANDLINGGIYEIAYDGTQFLLLTIYNAGILSVSQGDMNTASHTFSAATATPFGSTAWALSNADTILSSGQYGLGVEASVSTADFGTASTGGWIIARNSTSYTASLRAINFGNTNARTIQGRQRYITSSPPYKVRGVDAGGFVYVLMDAAGKIMGTSAGEAPPWVNNGPTRTTCDHKCPVTGKKFTRVREKRSIEEIMDGAEAVYNLEEITESLKNADMGVIPHPFGEIPAGWQVVLMDYTDQRIERLVKAQTDGELDISEMIVKGYLKVGQDEVSKILGPDGVPLHRMEYKYTGKKKNG